MFIKTEVSETKYLRFDNPILLHKYCAFKIIYLGLSIISAFRFFKAKRRVIKKKYYTSICAIFKNEAPYLEEWIEYHKIIGIDHFYLYNNFSEDNYDIVLQKYINEGIVTLIDWPYPQGQMSAYNNCVEVFCNETNWISFIDLDEFIVPNFTNDISVILKKFENRPNIIAYWKYFGTAGHVERDTKGLVIEDFTVSSRKYLNIGKIFYNTAYDWSPNNKNNSAMHYRVSECRGETLLPVNFWGKICWSGVDKAVSDYPPVQINHYVTRSYKEYEKKFERGDAYFSDNPRSLDYFYYHERMSESVDYNIYKYLLELKIKLGRGKVS